MTPMIVSPAITRYFRAPYVADALESASTFAKQNNWIISERAELYSIANVAFGDPPCFDDFDQIYTWLVKYWKIGRNGILWDAHKVFDTLVSECSISSRQTNISLMGGNSERSNAMAQAIHALSDVKRSLSGANLREYPHMPASKFLHFYNPSLYPIYDNDVIWKFVLKGTFQREWAEVCRQYGIVFTEGTNRFLYTYFNWASEVMHAADSDIMDTFADWFRVESGLDKNALPNLNRYYAACFEFILIGAAVRH